MILNKYCVTCKTTENLMPKPYSKNTNKKGETRGWFMCRSCNTQRIKKWRNTGDNMLKVSSVLNTFNKKYPLKQQAYWKVKYALKTGKLKRPDTCSMCSERKKIEGHHYDYNKPLDVTWVCRQCHATIHRELDKVT